MGFIFKGGGKFTGCKNEIPMCMSGEFCFGFTSCTGFSCDFLARKRFFNATVLFLKRLDVFLKRRGV